MQYKILVCAFLLALPCPAAFAQRKAGNNHTKSDTTVIFTGKEAQRGGQLLACNEPVAAKGIVTPFVAPKAACKAVPLAGQRSYFGEMNDYVNDFVRQYLQAHNQTLNVVQSRSTTPFSLIDNVLEKNKLPKELKYLAVIESALNHNAVSNVGAVGPWQLMEPTARMMGLSVNASRDDRTDWYKSTNAAAKYLALLYSQLNDWLLVIAAYNSGPTPVQRAIERTGSHNFWDIKKYLPRETQGHVLAFIATASIFEHLSKFIGLGSIPMDFKFSPDEPRGKNDVAKAATQRQVFSEEELRSMAIVRITQPISFELMGQELGIDKKLLARWNPDYELFYYNTYPTPYYSLRIPKDKTDDFLQKKESLNRKSKKIYEQMTML